MARILLLFGPIVLLQVRHLWLLVQRLPLLQPSSPEDVDAIEWESGKVGRKLEAARYDRSALQVGSFHGVPIIVVSILFSTIPI